MAARGPGYLLDSPELWANQNQVDEEGLVKVAPQY